MCLMKLVKPLTHLLSSILNSRAVVVIIILIILIRNLDLGIWKIPDRIISWDVISYYAYLPATFIYHDPTLEFFKNPEEDFSKKFWPVVSPTGKPVIMTTMGMSILYAPFFFMAHLYTQFSEYKADGYTEPYRFFLIISCIFYMMLGLIYLRKIVII